MIKISELEACNRCCSKNQEYINEDTIKCKICNFTESVEIWQLIGWRDIFKYPPTYSGIIFVYGNKIGRNISKWDSLNKSCNLEGVSHWLRTPDPTKQINM